MTPPLFEAARAASRCSRPSMRTRWRSASGPSLASSANSATLRPTFSKERTSTASRADSLHSGKAMRRLTRASCVRGRPRRAHVLPKPAPSASARASGMRSSSESRRSAAAAPRRSRRASSARGGRPASGRRPPALELLELRPDLAVDGTEARQRLVEALGLTLRLRDLAGLRADPVDVPALVLRDRAQHLERPLRHALALQVLVVAA